MKKTDGKSVMMNMPWMQWKWKRLNLNRVTEWIKKLTSETR